MTKPLLVSCVDMDGYVLSYPLDILPKFPETLSITAEKWGKGEITPTWVHTLLGENFIELVTALFAYTDSGLQIIFIQLVPTGKTTMLKMMLSSNAVGQGQSTAGLNEIVQEFVKAQNAPKEESEAVTAA